jgi:hypothetical protein
MSESKIVYYEIKNEDSEENTEEPQTEHDLLMQQLKKLSKKSEEVFHKIETQRHIRLANKA